MTHYLIEFRFFGKAKRDIKKLVWDINRRCHVRPKHRPVPHVTLAGPFSTRDQRRLVRDFKRVCSSTKLMKYRVKGFGTFENTRVVFINITPDKNLDEFRWNLAKTIRSYCYLKDYDLKRQFEHHATLAMKLSHNKFKEVKNFIKNKTEPEFRHILLRVTLLRNTKILFEYDFMLRRLLNRREAKRRKILNQTLKKLREFFDGQYDPNLPIGFPDKERLTLFDKIKGIFVKKKVFLFSDAHLDHTNIIKYCNRPFKSTSEMNRTLVDNWNKTVSKFDTVYFLGDMSFGKGSRGIEYWAKKLNGNIIFIKGCHDSSKRIKFHQNLILKCHDKEFYLIHDPAHAPKSWRGWVIHGHHHNNKPEYPLVSKKNKTINVSAELLDYRPIEIGGLLKMLV